MNILILGDVVGPAGVKAVKEKLPKIIREKKVDKVKTIENSSDKVGRNDPCYCGSGIKYKKCGMVDKCIKKS